MPQTETRFVDADQLCLAEKQLFAMAQRAAEERRSVQAVAFVTILSALPIGCTELATGIGRFTFRKRLKQLFSKLVNHIRQVNIFVKNNNFFV